MFGTINRPIRKGGLNIPNIGKYYVAMNISSIVKMLSRPLEEKWAQIEANVSSNFNCE